MSKAFIKESEAGIGEDALLADVDPLPEGARNLVTPGGAQRLKTEMSALSEERIPGLKKLLAEADQGQGHWEGEALSAARRELQTAEHRLRMLGRHAAVMEVVRPQNQVQDRVFFGARISVEANGEAQTYHIVGVDDADPGLNRISWLSPLAVALRGARVGEKRVLDLPGGFTQLAVLTIAYPEDIE